MKINHLFTEAMRSRRALALLCGLAMMICALLLLGLQAAKPAHAASTTFTVNSTGDAPDANPGNGTCQTAMTGECTLRAAIEEANANNNDPTVDVINFAIPGAGPHTISPTSVLPPITEAVTINGYSESLDEGTTPASENTLTVGNNAVLKIELDGTNAGDGLTIRAANSTVKGLVINRFSNRTVWIDGSGSTGNKVEGNFIGTDAAGTADLGNLYGVYIENQASSNTVGGTQNGARNIISGNVIGVSIFLAGATGNQVMGNYIGTDAAGTQPLGNNLGVLINGASSNTVGGTEAGARNIISSNTPSPTFGQDGDGVYITSPGTTNNKVEGNYIGTDALGTADLGNAGSGVRIDNQASSNPILSNSIFDNGELGIDLVGGDETTFGFGVTKNDNKDPDKGANMRQNFPVLSSATLSGGQITISGLLNSRPRKTFTIQFFSSPSEDPSTARARPSWARKP